MKKVILKYEAGENSDDLVGQASFDPKPVYWQHDRVYVPRNYKKNMNFPKLIMRTEMYAVNVPARTKFILKRHIVDSHVDIVNETVVKDYKETVNIIHQLGFEKIAEISKRRQDIDHESGAAVTFDKIDNVEGTFVKIEKVIEDGEKVENAREELKKIAEELGLDDEMLIKKSYSEMM